MYCSNCGEKIVENAKFCQKCGTPVMPVNTEPFNANAYGEQPQPSHTIPGEAQEYNASPALATTPSAEVFNYTAPPQQAYTPPPAPAPGHGEPPTPPQVTANKVKSKIWIPIAAGIVVLILIFGALALFTDIFTLGNNTGEEQTAASSRRRDDEDETDIPTKQDESEAEAEAETETELETVSTKPEQEQGPIESLVFTWEGLTLRAEGYSATINENINDSVQLLDRIEIYFAIEADENNTTYNMLTSLMNEQEPFAFVDEYGEEYGCFLSRSKTKDPTDFFSPLEWFSIGSLELADANIQDYESIVFRTPDIVIPFRLLENISSAPESASESSSATVTLLVKNIYISMQGTGVNAVRFVEEDAPDDVIYTEWGDWFENATFDSGFVLEGSEINISFQDDALLSELRDGVVDVTFVVDGSYFNFSMSVGSRIAAERTPDGKYLLLTDETRALE